MSDLMYLANFIRTLKWEGVTLAALMAVLTYKAGTPLWFLLVAFPIFDLSALGYLFNTKIGAWFYNVGHSAILPTLAVIAGLLLDNHILSIWAFAWLFHIGVDRALGFGLKDTKSFHHTHLGIIKKRAK